MARRPTCLHITRYLAISLAITVLEVLPICKCTYLRADEVNRDSAPTPLARPAQRAGNHAVAVPDFAKNVLVHVDGKIRPLGEVVRQKAADPQQALYRELRVATGGTPDGQLDLARWCRKQKMAEEEQLHWWILLSMQPGHPEAIKALRLRRYQGALLTSDEIERVKDQKRQADEAAKRWIAKLKKLKQLIEHGAADERATALRELKSIQDPRAIASIEQVFSIEANINLQLVELWAKMPADEAADALLRLAVNSPDEYVRDKAAEALRQRPYESYVPTLIARMAAPIEMSFVVSVDPGAPIYKGVEWQEYTGRTVGLYDKVRLHSAYRIQDVMMWTPETRRRSGIMQTGYRPDRYQYNYFLSRDSPDPETPYEYAGSILDGDSSRKKPRQRALIEDLEKKVKETNAKQALLNQRIQAALLKATSADIVPGDAAKQGAEVKPKTWWDWWKKQSQLNNYLARGTEVWTLTGLAPIEQVLVGDRVLTREPKSGDLSFHLVIGLDEQPQSEMRVVELGFRTIVATPEQRFFVTDGGWRKASALQTGMKLDGLAGPRSIESVSDGAGVEKFGIVVADVPNFFVDQHGILVHDATRE
jgi:hypothetical protein